MRKATLIPDAMYNFLVQVYSTYKGLFGWLSWLSYVSNVFLHPILQVVMYSLLGRFARSPEAAQGYALGIATLSIVFIIMSGIVQSYAYERSLGTMPFLFVSPVNRLVNFLARPLLHYPNGLLAFATGLVSAWIIVDMDFAMVEWTGLVVAVLVMAGSVAAFGQFLGIFVLVYRNWIPVLGAASGIMVAFAGAIIPITVFPEAVQEFARILPMTNGLLALRAAFAGALFSEVSGLLLRELLTGLAYYALAYTGFVLFERRARRIGSLAWED